MTGKVGKSQLLIKNFPTKVEKSLNVAFNYHSGDRNNRIAAAADNNNNLLTIE